MFSMNVTIKRRNNGFEGVVRMPYLAETKMVKKNGTTIYENMANLITAARQLAGKYNCGIEFNAPAMVAAKKSPR